MKKLNLKEKYIVLTGASQGIGKEMSRLLAQEGANLVLCTIPSDKAILQKWAKELEAANLIKTWTVLEDLSTEDGALKLYRKVKKMIPHIDVLINNAGTMTYGPFHEIPLDEHNMVLHVNTSTPMTLMRCILPDMIKRGEGRILNISSVAALQPTPSFAVYGATKAYLQSISEAVAQEVKDYGIIISTLNPSFTNTGLLKVKNFPKRLKMYNFSSLSEPADIARKGIWVLKKGKAMHIPGLKNRLIHSFFMRFASRRLVSSISNYTLQKDE